MVLEEWEWRITWGELLAGSLAGLSSGGAELFCFLKRGTQIKNLWKRGFFCWRLNKIEEETHQKPENMTGNMEEDTHKERMMEILRTENHKTEKTVRNPGQSVNMLFNLCLIPRSSVSSLLDWLPSVLCHDIIFTIFSYHDKFTLNTPQTTG